MSNYPPGVTGQCPRLRDEVMPAYLAIGVPDAALAEGDAVASRRKDR